MSNNGPRFQAREGAFVCTVVDTIRPRVSSVLVGLQTTICECDDIETAIIIARALNREAMS